MKQGSFYMLNYLWAVMIAVGIIYGVFSGNMEAVTNGALDSAKEAISLCLNMCGIMALWMGLMEIAKTSGLIGVMTRKISPFVSFMFPRIPKDHPAREAISTNIIANILGLGWAATPAGLKAMEELCKLEEERGNPEYISKDLRKKEIGLKGQKESERTASNEMCVFLIMNIASLQLIPVNMIAYRSQYGSVSPTAVIAPGLIATFVSAFAAVMFCKIMDGTSGKR